MEYIIPRDCEVTFCLIRNPVTKPSDYPLFHDRMVLTEIGGMDVKGHGLFVPRRDPDRPIQILDKKAYEKLWKDYFPIPGKFGNDNVTRVSVIGTLNN